ncbi:MAG TPA: MarC family protein [Rhabdochlamydiaceae bacterium]|nr:MarC family protein [Rhabdochlamydiaceae bacterium]
MSVISVTTSLFFVLNALGNVPFFVGILSSYSVQRQRRIIIREMLIALLILICFNFFGDEILKVLGIDHCVVGIAGGTLLFLIALSMIFPKRNHLKVPHREPFVFPLAIPAIAGPGAITAVMIYSQQAHNPFWMLMPITLAWLISASILLASSNIKLFLGQKGLIACERLGGMVISLIAVQMFTTGVMGLFEKGLKPCVPGSPESRTHVEKQKN